MDKYEKFVREIAEQNPIVADVFVHEDNACVFCYTPWAEDNFSRYLVNVSLGKGRLEHHDFNCLWVKANLCLR